ncbi:MAG: SPASM domain-containing protein, partial [Candidatus Omnitrophica bacterium]|nr:SPASM domain-containing protein [Candidatus Omnitrophota bacterium]
KEKKVWIIFFGGEPFLNFPVIKETVKYIKKIKNREFIITIATNATLMNRSICKWLSKNDIEIMAALDLPASEHNKNRPFKDGSPSFEIVKNNLLLLSKNIPSKNLKIRAVITKDADIKISDAFKIYSELGLPIYDLCPAPEVIGVNDLRYKSCPEERFYRSSEYQKTKLRKELLKKVAKSNQFSSLGLYKRLFSSTGLFVIVDGRPPERECHFRNQMSIKPNGDIYFCDIVSSNKEFCLGNIKTGFDKKKIKSIKKRYLFKPKYCKNCWASSFCHRFCPSLVPYKNIHRKDCQHFRTEFIEILKIFLNFNYNQISNILDFMLYATYDKNYIENQKDNFKTVLEIYRFLNEKNKYIKPINIFPCC